jgi:predicted AAA+ superfamily ATPase
VDASAKQMLISENIFKEFKGSFTEQFVLQQLVAMDITPYYWSSETTPAEIDFVIKSNIFVTNPQPKHIITNEPARLIIESIRRAGFKCIISNISIYRFLSYRQAKCSSVAKR